MAHYVDGFVLVVPKKNVEAYKKMAKVAGKVWKKHGALEYKECMIEDPKPKWVTLTFPKMIKAKPGDTVWFSYIVYKSRRHRDQVNAKVMKDSMMNEEKWKNTPMPFDMKRMAYAGFAAAVDL